jgi:hypothetical protein
MGSPVTNEEATILLITQPAPQVNFHCRGSNLVNTKATTSTHPHYYYYYYYYYYSVTKNNLQMHSIVNRWKFNNWCQNACKRSVWIYGPRKTMHHTILTALLANYTTISTSCNGTAGINVRFSADQHPLFWVFLYPWRWNHALTLFSVSMGPLS